MTCFVVVDLLFIIATIASEGLCLVLVMEYLVSFLVCNNPAEEERTGCFIFIVCLMSYD